MPKMFNINRNENIFLYAGYTTAIGFSGILLATVLSYRKRKYVSQSNVVLITGCDSGLGYNFARRCHDDLKMTVIAGCMNTESEGAIKLKTNCTTNRLHLIQIDIRNKESIQSLHQSIDKLFQADKNLVLTALVNNAGVMCFGELEWQTDKQIDYQIEVNLLGTMKFTKSFLPLIRAHKSRIITVTSHCGLFALPGLAPYAAAKVGLRFFNDSLRIEMRQYGVDVVNFIPGSFVMTSNIVSRQQEYAEIQRESMSKEQLQFYGKYFDQYTEYLKIVSGRKPVELMNDEKLMDKFDAALLDVRPKSLYKYEPWRYTFYHLLFRCTPTVIRDWLIVRFMGLPQYTKPTK